MVAIGNIGYTFRDPSYLETLRAPASLGFQRLEFFGDGILDLVIREALMEKYPNDNQGFLTKRKATIVNGDTCRQIGARMQLIEVLGLTDQAVSHNCSTLADAVEALLGAIWFDTGGDLSLCRAWVLRWWGALLDQDTAAPPMDPKMALQEWVQGRMRCMPRYELLEKLGPDHAPSFRVCVSVPDHGMCEGEGTTKKTAEKNAAEAMLRRCIAQHSVAPK